MKQAAITLSLIAFVLTAFGSLIHLLSPDDTVWSELLLGAGLSALVVSGVGFLLQRRAEVERV